MAMAVVIALTGTMPVQSAPQTGAAGQRRAQTGKAPAKTPTKRSELAHRKREFEEKLIAQEKNAWEEEKKQNADFFREEMTEQLIPTARMTSYELTDFHVIRAGRDAAVITYRATFIGPVEGKETTTKVLATTVWVRRGEIWKMAFHQKTLAPEKP
jgi:hypothetical protein